MLAKFQTRGSCCKEIVFDIDKDDNYRVSNIVFYGGCNGNLKMIAKLVNGMTADEIIAKCSGNICGNKGTSCADQLAKAVAAAKEQI